MIAQIESQEINLRCLELEDGDPNCQAVYRGCNEENRSYLLFRTDQGNANPEKRCDYLLIDPGSNLAWYIELKGKNHWDTACEQLLNTFNQFSEELAIPIENSFFRLVSSGMRSGMRVFRSYTSYRQLLLALPHTEKHFGLIFSSKEGLHRDFEELNSLQIIAEDAVG